MNDVPLHLQLRNLLKREISEGKHKVKIPSERELMERYTVSRTTVREAISSLVNEGTVKKVHGKGTFICAKPKVQEWLNSLHSFTETVKRMGMVPGAELLFHKEVEAEPAISTALETSRIYTIQRIRTANADPVAIERHYYQRHIGLLLASHNLEDAVIYDLLERNLALNFADAEQTITCQGASEDDANFLSVTAGSHLLVVERVIKDEEGKPIEYYRGHFRPDMYEFRMKMKREI
ncbi:hypothetical protein AB990_07860 [Alkalihalobacillus pseudalcaliphilus]|nr:hypothetical protein AB990_07860 [Alkalihalobacillus pseudalcaliphilus]